MFVAIMAFHARISDPRVGGTYLTLLNTVTNLGGNWCQTLALWLVDGLTWTNCLGASIPGLNCSSKTSAKVQGIILDKHILKQWMTLLTRSDWLFKLQITFAIHLRETRAQKL